MTSEYDVLIKNVQIIDGSGAKAETGSIGVKGDRVTAIGKINGDAENIIDAEGLIASPGFIDAHSHADMTLLWYPYCENYVMQGVTTWVGGQCGMSNAPIAEYTSMPPMLDDHKGELVPHLYHAQSVFPVDTINSWMDEKFGFQIDWKTMDEFFKVVEKKGISTNYVPLVGHGAVRIATMGLDNKRDSTTTERAQMGEMITVAMDDGCFGMSAGLDYDPDVFASKAEIDDVVALLKEYDGVYCPHWRRTGRREGIGAGHVQADRLSGILEVIDTCRVTGTRLNIAHLYGGYEVSPTPSPRMQEAVGYSTLDVIDEAINEGLDMSFDCIPYKDWDYLDYLCVPFFTPWLRLHGTRENLARWLRVEDFREEIKESLSSGKWFIRPLFNPNLNPNWSENITIVRHSNKDYEWKTLSEIVEGTGKGPLDVLMDLIMEDPDARSASIDYRGSEEYVDVFFKHPLAMVGNDTHVMDDKRVRHAPPYSVPGLGTYAAYPSFFNLCVKEKKLFSLEDAIMKCTSLVAKTHRIKERGLLRPGYFADIVLFDFDRLKVTGTAIEPRRYPEGIEHVFVNGEQVVKNGEHSYTKPGKVLKHRGN